MPMWLTWLVGLAALVGESALLGAFGVDGWSLQTAVVMTIFLALRRDFVSGAVVLAGLLAPIEWMVGGPMGVHALSLTAVFFVLQLAKGNLESPWGLSQSVLAVFTVAFQTAMMALTVLVVYPDAELMESLWWGALPGAIGAAVVAWPFGAALTWFDQIMDPRAGRSVNLPS